jgi:peroxiredoxin
MPIQVGQRIPEVILKRLGNGMETIDTLALFEGRKVVLFAIPGAFTPTCSARHLPGYVEHFEQFRQMGIEVMCMAVNDPFVMKAWGESQSIPEGLHMLSDGNAELSRALDLEMDASSSGMGRRSRRFALYVEDGVVKASFIEEPGQFEVSSAEHVLGYLRDNA